MKAYQVLIPADTYQQLDAYQGALAAGRLQAGSRLTKQLAGHDLAQLETPAFIELLINTKQPQIFAESAVHGDGSDWSPRELSLLGDISIAVPVTVFDNGQHTAPKVYDQPFSATLIYVPGALLRNGYGKTPADWDEVTKDGQIDPQAYYRLYERRLLPALLYANQVAADSGKKAFITIPGLGCGQFAGPFRGQLGEQLRQTLRRLLEQYASVLPRVGAVYYDPYQECHNERHQIEHIHWFVRPLTQGNAGKSQLCPPQQYAQPGDDFSTSQLFSLVAWDHVSWPGNDFYLGSRVTDDGVKAAATDSMAVMTGLAGTYHVKTNSYDPPSGYRNWAAVVSENKLRIKVKNNLLILPEQNTR